MKARAGARFRAKNAAKNREEFKLPKIWGWGRNRDFWPEYSPLYNSSQFHEKR